MKKYISYIILPLIIIIIFYLIGSFTFYNFNPKYWNEDTRGLLATASLLSGIVSLIVKYAIDENC